MDLKSDLSLVADLLVVVMVISIVMALRSVRGSRPRYFWLSVDRAVCICLTALETVKMIIAAFEKDFIGVGLYAVAVVFYAWFSVRPGDDDWFTGRGKKIRDGIRKRLQARAPRPALV
jgi:hypothetical protein